MFSSFFISHSHSHSHSLTHSLSVHFEFSIISQLYLSVLLPPPLIVCGWRYTSLLNLFFLSFFYSLLFNSLLSSSATPKIEFFKIPPPHDGDVLTVVFNLHHSSPSFPSAYIFQNGIIQSDLLHPIPLDPSLIVC